MKRLISLLCVLTLVFSLAACGNEQTKVDTPTTTPAGQPATTPNSAPTDADATLPDTPSAEDGKTLVVFFSMPDDVDDSTVEIDGKTLGNTQYMAQIIQQTTNADIFRIEPETPYPTNHEELVDLAKEEQNNNSRPAIKDTIANFESYDTVFVGYPIWWSDLPMILYTFFDTYDFTGKTIVPFSTHGGSSFAGTPATIAELEPEATIAEGMTVSRNDIQDAAQDVIDWLQSDGYAE